jgi:hypothetical protein
LHNRIPVDDEDFQAEMDRIAAEGGDPFFLTPENWEGTNGNIEEEDEQTGTSMKLVTFSETETRILKHFRMPLMVRVLRPGFQVLKQMLGKLGMGRLTKMPTWTRTRKTTQALLTSVSWSFTVTWVVP